MYRARAHRQPPIATREIAPCALGEPVSHYVKHPTTSLFPPSQKLGCPERAFIGDPADRKIDPAALRPGRFGKNIFVGPPDLEARMELLGHYLKDRPQEALDLLDVAKDCDGYTCAELEHVVNETARRALNSQRLICCDDMIAALAANPPAHTDEREAAEPM